ncbi:hypothetical protein JCM10207_005180 [Rhodosporidiobolus poonsookiae]
MKSVAALLTASFLASSVLAHGHHAGADRQALHRRGAAKHAGFKRQKPLLAVVDSNATDSTTTTSAAAPSASASASSAVVVPTVFNGTALWFYESGGLGACLQTNTDDDLVVGLPDTLWRNTGVVSPLCGEKVVLTNTDNGKTVTATVADASGKEYVTLTRAAFLQLSPLSVGMIPVEYTFPELDRSGSSAASSAAAASSSAVSTGASAGVFNPSAADVKIVTAAATSAPIAAATTAAPVATTTEAPTTTFDSASAARAAASSKAAAEAAASEEAADEAASSKAAAAAAASKEAAQEAAAEASSSSAAAAASSRQAYLLAAQHSADAAEAAASSSAAAAAAASSQAAAEAAASSSAAAAAASSKAAAAAASSQAAAAAAASQAAQATSSGHVYTGGIATFFYQNGVAGNCGNVNSDSTPLVALPTKTYAGGKYCGQYVSITRLDTGDSIKALVADSCPTCENDNCLDLSWGAFTALGGTQSMGVFDIKWSFI